MSETSDKALLEMGKAVESIAQKLASPSDDQTLAIVLPKLEATLKGFDDRLTQNERDLRAYISENKEETGQLRKWLEGKFDDIEEKQSTPKDLRLIWSIVAFFIIGAFSLWGLIESNRKAAVLEVETRLENKIDDLDRDFQYASEQRKMILEKLYEEMNDRKDDYSLIHGELTSRGDWMSKVEEKLSRLDERQSVLQKDLLKQTDDRFRATDFQRFLDGFKVGRNNEFSQLN